MPQPQATEKMIECYFSSTVTAIGTLFEKNLYGHTLIIIFSAIDTFGLLDAPSGQTSANGESFKNWVKKYLLSQAGVEFSEVDLWAARCGVLHTFTSESDLSKRGNARQLQYYSGDKQAPDIQAFISAVKSLESGAHLPVHYGELCTVFFAAIKKFALELDSNCKADKTYNDRLLNILQIYPMNETQ